MGSGGAGIALPTITVAEVVARVESLLEGLKSSDAAPVAAFDGDGTLWSGDVGEDYFHAFVAAADVRPFARDALAAVARAHGLDDTGDGTTLARRLFTAYESGEFPEETICEVIAWSGAGRSWAEFRQFFETRFPPTQMRARIHEETLSLMEEVRRRGVEVFLVSASPKPVVEAAAAVAGVSEDHVIAAEPAVVGGVVQPSARTPIPYGPGKVSRLRERIGERPLLVACGDNAFDEALLRAAHVGCAIRPKPRLLAIASRIEGLRVLRL